MKGRPRLVLDASRTPEARRATIRRLLKQGDVLVRAPSRTGGVEWSLARSGQPVLEVDATTILLRPFRRGRLVPSGDYLPGIGGQSQTFYWRADGRAPGESPA